MNVIFVWLFLIDFLQLTIPIASTKSAFAIVLCSVLVAHFKRSTDELEVG